jgi:hypothetical protein
MLINHGAAQAKEAGIIYGVDSSGDLHWYKYSSYATGGSVWDSASGAIVGHSFNSNGTEFVNGSL